LKKVTNDPSWQIFNVNPKMNAGRPYDMMRRIFAMSRVNTSFARWEKFEKYRGSRIPAKMPPSIAKSLRIIVGIRKVNSGISSVTADGFINATGAL
jgi:hypothetical protein